jgi:hypothetical protein
VSDITMCGADDCHMQRKCIRHKDSGTKPNERAQSYLMRDGTSPKGEDISRIAKGLSEGQSNELSGTDRLVSWPMWLKVQRPDLVYYELSPFHHIPWLRLTPLGLAVRDYLKEHEHE